jgi:hypothetical protein
MCFILIIKNWDTNQLLASGVFLINITLSGPFLFVFAAFGTPSGDSADAAAEVGLDFAQKSVIAKGTAGSRMQAQAINHALRGRRCLQYRFPFPGGHLPEAIPRQKEARWVSALPAMHRRARPGILPCLGRHPRPDRVQLDIGRRMIRMGVIQRTRVEAVLPEMPQPPMQPVDILRVHQVRPAQRFRQRRLLLRRHQKMDMIGHQTVRRDRQPIALRDLFQIRQIDPVIRLHKEDILPVITPLGHMMRHPGYHTPRLPGHEQSLSRTGFICDHWLLSRKFIA